MKLWIDAGHGASNRKPGVYDPGACAGGLEEADIALTWALTGKWVARGLGIDVFLTRDDEGDPSPVDGRAGKAYAAGCTHGISLHCNAGPILAAGTETFYRNERSRLWVADINRHAVKALGTKNRGIKTESLSQHTSIAVLGFPGGPMALLELGFITNTGDRKRLLSRDARVAFWTEFLKGVR